MKKNLSTLDRLGRIIAAMVLVAMWLSNMYTSHIPMIIAGILFFTAVIGRCGIYALFGYSTCPVKEQDHNAAHYVAEDTRRPQPPESAKIPDHSDFQ